MNDPKLKDVANGKANTALLDAAGNATVQEREIKNRDARAAIENARKLREIQNAADDKRFDLNANFQARLIEVNARPGNEIAAAQQAAQVQLDLEQKRLQIEFQRAQLEGDVDKQVQIELKLRLSDEEHLLKIREEGELRIAEIRKKDFEEFESGAGKVFDALQAKGNHTALRDLVKTELTGLERKLFVNASGILFDQTGGKGLGFSSLIGGQRDPDGKLTGIGRLLQGTPFGDKGLSDPTIKTADNTFRTAVAVEKIAGGLAGTGSGGTVSFPFLGDSGSNGDLSSAFSFLGGSPNGTGASVDPFAFLGGSAAASPASVSSFAGSLASAKSFAGALASGAIHPDQLLNVLTGNSTASTASQIGTGLSAAGVIFGGAETAIKDFKKGGVGGISGGIGAIVGSAAALDPEPLSKAVLAGVALVSSIVGDIFGNSKQQRANQISNYIAGSQHTLPYSTGPISQDFDISGSNVIYGTDQKARATGNLTQPVVNFNISTLDSKSFETYATDNAHIFAGAVNAAMLNDHPVVQTIQQRFAQ